MTAEGLPYGPGSMVWLVNKEVAVLLAGGRALLLQLANPGVAAGVDEHSDFRQHPLRRLWRTLDRTLQLAFGDPDALRLAARRINQAHREVRGAGYRASDPDLLLWVHATLIDSALTAYETFFRPLTAAEREAYYQESKPLGAMLGLPAGAYPPTYDDFSAWWEATLASPTLRIDKRARELAAVVLRPPVRMLPGWLWTPLAILTAGLLPEQVRAGYGLAWRERDRRAYRVLVAAVRATRHLPAPLREVPPARRRRR
ncbi:MAG: oxygenase MpaB family protein, partial [Candidatus Dormibacteraceae bacterium]